jgi:hypothetical protein
VRPGIVPDVHTIVAVGVGDDLEMFILWQRCLAE